MPFIPNDPPHCGVCGVDILHDTMFDRVERGCMAPGDCRWARNSLIAAGYRDTGIGRWVQMVTGMNNKDVKYVKCAGVRDGERVLVVDMDTGRVLCDMVARGNIQPIFEVKTGQKFNVRAGYEPLNFDGANYTIKEKGENWYISKIDDLSNAMGETWT